MTNLSRKHKVVVDFISNDGNFVPFSNVKDLLEMRNAEHAPTRIGGIVDDDCCSLVINQRLHVVEVHLPVLVR